jgi:hypothetical protein
VKRLVVIVTLGLIAFAAIAAADAIQKWRTPDGSLYFGDRPPTGSTLLETYPDSPAVTATVAPSDVAALSQAAADGRDIIRRREAAREAERQADAAREARMAEVEASQIDGYDWPPFWFITGGVSPCRFGTLCGLDDFRFPRRHPPHDHFFPENHFFPNNHFFRGNHVFPGNHFFPNNHLVAKPFTPLRPAPAPVARRSFQMSARFGGRH